MDSINHSRKSWPVSVLLSMVIGVIGMLFTCAGNFLPLHSFAQKLCFLLGGLTLFTAAAIAREQYFMALQVVVISGAASAFMLWPAWLKGLVPLIVCLLVMAYFTYCGLWKNKLIWLGALGIIFLALGFSISHPLIYLLGGLVLIVYSSISYARGVKIAFLWIILNIIFAITSAWALIQS